MILMLYSFIFMKNLDNHNHELGLLILKILYSMEKSTGKKYWRT